MAEDQLTDIDKMKNVELRAELKRRGCSTVGNKKDLITRLHAAIQNDRETSLLNCSVEHSHNENSSDNDQTTIQRASVSSSINDSQEPLESIVDEHHQQPSVNILTNNDVSTVPSISEEKLQSHSEQVCNESTLNSNSDPTTDQQPINDEKTVMDTSVNGDSLNIKSFVSKSIEEEKKNIERIGVESYTPSVGSHSAKSEESILKETPLIDEQQSEKQIFAQVDSQHSHLVINDKEQKSAIDVTNDDIKKQTLLINAPSNVNLSADLNPSIEDSQSSIAKENQLNADDKPGDNVAFQQKTQIKSSQSQTSSFMKGFHRTSIYKLNLSCETLKTLISDMNLMPESVVNNELDALMNEQLTHINNTDHKELVNHHKSNNNKKQEFLPVNSMTIGDLADQEQQTVRTVVMNGNLTTSLLNDAANLNKTTDSVSTYTNNSSESKKFADTKTHNNRSTMSDEPIQIKHSSTINEPISQILYICGLTRPFSLSKLKDLLRRYGKLVEGKFWLDKIKSQCLVTFSTVEEARIARDELDGCRWPSTNQKTLSVRFAQQTELEFSKCHDLPPTQMSIDSVDRIIQDKSNVIHTYRSNSPANKMETNIIQDNSDVRECDVLKLPDKKGSGFLINEDNEPAKSIEPPAKGLDDYFRKTNAKPSIYWLPLADEEIIKKKHRLEQRNIEREDKRRKQQIDENRRSTNAKSSRRSSPFVSKEKRKHRSSSTSSSSSSVRPSKRH